VEVDEDIEAEGLRDREVVLEKVLKQEVMS
jgi:hypothetical protein